LGLIRWGKETKTETEGDKTVPTFDPTKPAANPLISLGELRDQLNTLNNQITTVSGQLSDLSGDAPPQMTAAGSLTPLRRRFPKRPRPPISRRSARSSTP
jgi:hypothetical protein